MKSYAAGICYCENKILLLKLSYYYNLCPGDWEFVTNEIPLQDKNLDISTFVLSNIRKYISLSGRIITTFPPSTFIDDENSCSYQLFPFIVRLNETNVDLSNSQKFMDYIWVDIHNVLNYDRLNYLKTYFKILNNLHS